MIYKLLCVIHYVAAFLITATCVFFDTSLSHPNCPGETDHPNLKVLLVRASASGKGR